MAEHRSIRDLLRHWLVASYSLVHSRFSDRQGTMVLTEGRRWGARLNIRRLGLAVYFEYQDDVTFHPHRDDGNLVTVTRIDV